MKNKKLSRRRFVQSAAVAAVPALFHIVPRHCLGGPGFKAPSEKLNIAGIGVGGKGYSDLMSVKDENIVALCDVDTRRDQAFKQWPDARRHTDFRKMLETQKDLDAVMIATPDHLHFHASVWAMKHGKHVYCQKPMGHTVAESRAMARIAKETGVATQMGNQGNAGQGVRLMQEWIEDGAIGPVHEVHCWTNKPVWPQGINRPQGESAIPRELDWDLWLGPAPQRPYHDGYLPFVWRGWWDFGSCALGDMGCHVLNNPWRALSLGSPTSVEAYSNGCTDETGPLSSIIYYEFAARQNMPAVKLTWYDGGMMPQRPPELEDDRRMGDNEGCLFIGEKAKMLCSCYGDSPRILPESLMQSYKRPAPRIPRSPGHYVEWVNACKGGLLGQSHFGHAAVLNEVVQLGNVAIRATHQIQENGRPVKLLWDAAAGKITNMPDANKFLATNYRAGWDVPTA